MPSTLEIIHEAEALPVEERALVVESLLLTLNRPDPTVENKWIEVAKRRMTELRTGQVKGIPADEVFAHIHRRFAE